MQISLHWILLCLSKLVTYCSNNLFLCNCRFIDIDIVDCQRNVKKRMIFNGNSIVFKHLRFWKQSVYFSRKKSAFHNVGIVIFAQYLTTAKKMEILVHVLLLLLLAFISPTGGTPEFLCSFTTDTRNLSL